MIYTYMYVGFGCWMPVVDRMPVVDQTPISAEGCWMPVVLLPPEGHWIFHPLHSHLWRKYIISTTAPTKHLLL